MKYYVDTSIWLNLFKKEGDETKGKPYWKIADEFLKLMTNSKNNEIVYSFVVLRELEIKLSRPEYGQRKKEIVDERRFICTDVLQEDKNFARKLESEYHFEMSFYDLLHLAVARRIGATIITRDNMLIEVCEENNVPANKPENILSSI